MGNFALRLISPSDLNAILELNDDAVAVTSPMDATRLEHLLEISALGIVAESDNQVVGFLIGMIDNAPYQNGNYQWFSERLKNFFYVDRIVISSQAQGLGIGQSFYSYVNDWALKNKIHQLAAEMDFNPPNSASLKFHQKNGFIPIGQRVLKNGKTVSMHIKPACIQAPTEMKYPIRIDAPNLGFGDDSWIINKWHFTNGDRVSRNDAICDMENDQITCEMESFDEGRIEILIKAGQTAAVGEIIALLHQS